MYISNEGNEGAVQELSLINDELIKNIDMEKRAKDEVKVGYEAEINRMRLVGNMHRVMAGVEVERLHEVIEK